jgi:sugar phosphate isomerase/epimerase
MTKMDAAACYQMPVLFALENNRVHSNESSIVTCEGVLSIVEEINLPNVGICWDFGHTYSNYVNFPEVAELTYPEPFIKRVVHTHIHAYEGRTHFPFMGKAALPLDQYCNQLVQVEYKGIYNLELDIERFYKVYSPRQAFEASILALRRCLGESSV